MNRPPRDVLAAKLSSLHSAGGEMTWVTGYLSHHLRHCILEDRQALVDLRLGDDEPGHKADRLAETRWHQQHAWRREWCRVYMYAG